MRYAIGLGGTVAALGLAGLAQAQSPAPASAPETASAPTPAASSAAATASDDIQTVTVTAQKRSQPLQDVPVAVTVMDSKALQNASIDTGSEVARFVPNVSVSLLGDESQPKFVIRGISTPTFNLNAISPTGVFFDDVYVGASYLGGAQMFDIERVEVLRGPQGTLFGKNTTAGAINFISKRPTFSNEGEVTVGYGSFGYKEVKGSIEAPLVENRLTARLAFTDAHSDGYIQDVNPGARNLSNIDRKAARLTLAYKDDAGFDGTLRVFTVHDDPRIVGAINEGIPGPLSSLQAQLGNPLCASPLVNAQCVNPRVNPYTGAPLTNRQTAANRDGNIIVRGDGGYLTLNKDIGFGTLTSITSYVAGSFFNPVDGDGTNQDLLNIDFGTKTREFSQDLRVNSSFDGPFQVIVGLYHQRDELDVNTVYSLYGDGPFLAPIPAFGFPGNGPLVLSQSYEQSRRSYAAYADGNYEISKVFNLYGGVRYTRDDGDMHGFQVASSVPGLGIPVQGDKTYSDGQPTGRLGLSAFVNKDFMVYGQWAKGYRSSAINGGALTDAADLNVVKPEHLTSYEVGVKSEWFDRQFTFNSSIYHYDFKDEQFINVLSLTSQQLVNAGRARLQGVEFEAILRPTKRLRLSASLGLQDSKYVSGTVNVQNAAGAVVPVDLSGKRMIESAPYTGSLGADYSMPVYDYTLTFHGDETLIGQQYFLADNDPSSKVGASHDVGARVALRSPSGKYEFAAYGKNLTNNSVAGGLQTDPGTQTRFTTVPYPRRYGVELSAKF